MADIINDSGVCVEIVQRYACYICGEVVEEKAQLPPGSAMFWRAPSWGRVGGSLICEKHTIKIEADGEPYPEWTSDRNYPRQKEDVHHG